MAVVQKQKVMKYCNLTVRELQTYHEDTQRYNKDIILKDIQRYNKTQLNELSDKTNGQNTLPRY